MLKKKKKVNSIPGHIPLYLTWDLDCNYAEKVSIERNEDDIHNRILKL